MRQNALDTPFVLRHNLISSSNRAIKMPHSKDPRKYEPWMMNLLMTKSTPGEPILFEVRLSQSRAFTTRSKFYGFLNAILNHDGYKAFHERAGELSTRLTKHGDGTATLYITDREQDMPPEIKEALTRMLNKFPTSMPEEPHAISRAIPTALPQANQTPIFGIDTPQAPTIEPPVEPPARELESVPIPPGATVQQRQAYPQEHCYRFNLVQLIEHMPAGAIPYWLIDMWKEEHGELFTDKTSFMNTFHSHFKSGELAKWWDNKRVNLQAVLNSENINANT